MQRGVYSPRNVEDPRTHYGLTDADLEGFRKDPELIEAVRLFTGRDFPMEQLDDALMAEIAGAVQKLGVADAVREFKTLIPVELQATIRGIAMKQRLPRVRG